MKQKTILLRCADDSVMIMSMILDNDFDIKRQGTDEEIMDEISRSSSAWEPSRLPIKSWEEILPETVSDRTFRNAWKTNGETIDHDMVKARDIHRDHLRNERLNYFLPLDNAYRKAEEDGDIIKKEAVRKKKQILRDITIHPDIEKAKNVEELKIAGLDVFKDFDG